MNDAAVDTGVQISLDDPDFISVDLYPEVDLLDHRAVLFLVFGGNVLLCFIRAVPFFVVDYTQHKCYCFNHFHVYGFRGTKYILNVQPSPPTISRTFHDPHIKTAFLE